jgi:hypothetical protein
LITGCYIPPAPYPGILFRHNSCVSAFKILSKSIKINDMKAVRIHEFGGPEVLKVEEVERPKPQADEVLIKVYATSVNPVDWKIRSGKNQERYHIQLPITLG